MKPLNADDILITGEPKRCSDCSAPEIVVIEVTPSGSQQKKLCKCNLQSH